MGVTINVVCLDFIRDTLPEGKTILEFGSGLGTTWLGESFNMYSVENQPEWVDAYPKSTTYINCRSKMYDETYTVPSEFPNDKGWYHPDDLFPKLPSHYDLMLIDGPGGWRHGWGRGGFFKHIDKFNTSVPMVFDDIDRPDELRLIKEVSNYLGKKYIILEDGATGVINND